MTINILEVQCKYRKVTNYSHVRKNDMNTILNALKAITSFYLVLFMTTDTEVIPDHVLHTWPCVTPCLLKIIFSPSIWYND